MVRAFNCLKDTSIYGTHHKSPPPPPPGMTLTVLLHLDSSGVSEARQAGWSPTPVAHNQFLIPDYSVSQTDCFNKEKNPQN